MASTNVWRFIVRSVGRNNIIAHPSECFRDEKATATFVQQDSMEDNAAVVLTYIEYTMNGEPFMQITAYDIYDGTNMYELISMNFYDTEYDYFDYLTYIASNITYAE